ncbi:MAG: D-alanyl-D-alanine carboxypeptidase family protein, partial [Gemmatimonadales bacterium]
MNDFDERRPEGSSGPMTAALTGRTDQHLCSSTEAESLGARIHREVLPRFRRLQKDARGEGFDLQILSGFRSFEQQ